MREKLPSPDSPKKRTISLIHTDFLVLAFLEQGQLPLIRIMFRAISCGEQTSVQENSALTDDYSRFDVQPETCTGSSFSGALCQAPYQSYRTVVKVVSLVVAEEVLI